MKLQMLALCLFIVLASNAQTEKPEYKTATDSFVARYNAGNYQAVYNGFAPTMQQALPLDKTNDFLTQLKQQLGSIKERTLVKYAKSYAVYKTTFEGALFSVNISVDDKGMINGLFFKPYQESAGTAPARNSTSMALPFKGEWTVVWGGDTKEQNYHVENEAQKHAFDIVIMDSNGKSFKTNGETNADYYAFGQPLLSPCDGDVVLVVDGVKDNKPGTMNPSFLTGNTVLIKTANNEYLVLAHFKQHSIVVKEGQHVTKGTLLGQCGNSGNSSEPHLHFHIQNIEDIATATGIKCYFEKLSVNGAVKTDYSPVQKEKISPQLR